jgi:hypothetical protein
MPSESSEEQEMASESHGVEISSESGEHEMRPIDTSKHPWMESDWWKEMVRASQEPDNFHQVHLPQVFDFGALTYLLESKGIAPLV